MIHTPPPVSRISAFGDEVADDLATQLDMLEAVGIHQLDLRGAWGRNIMALSDDDIAVIQRELARRGMRVACIASPIGKDPVSAPLAPQLAALDRALDIAEMLGTRYVRIFSWYIPEGDDPSRHRDDVLDRLGSMAQQAAARGIVLVHENERGLYGDSPARCHDLLESVASPALRAVWDPGNFVACGFDPLRDTYPLLRPWIEYVHVKDVDRTTRTIVVAGKGDAGWPECIAALSASGYSGPFALEPHLAVAGAKGGFSGPALFREAATALRGLLERYATSDST